MIKIKIYTKKGDKGVALSPSGLKSKDSLIFEVFGTIDEVQSLIGILYEEIKDRGFIKLEEDLLNLLKIKYHILSALYYQKDLENDESIMLESLIDEMTNELKPLSEFILPIGNKASAQTHLTRVVSRRLERIFYKWLNSENISYNNYENIAKYLNRLSDYLFTLARYLSKE